MSWRSKLLEFGVADETAWQSGLPCGGTMKVFLERFEGISDVAYLDARGLLENVVIAPAETRFEMEIVGEIAHMIEIGMNEGKKKGPVLNERMARDSSKVSRVESPRRDPRFFERSGVK